MSTTKYVFSSNRALGVMSSLLLFCTILFGQPLMADMNGKKWATSWLGAVHGPYPVGNPSAQPDLSLVFPSPKDGANDQSFRMIVKPSIWGNEMRIRLSNVLGSKPVTFDGVFIGMHLSSSAIVPGTNHLVKFGGKESVTVAAGDSVWSDPVKLRFAANPNAIELAGRNLAVSFHIVGESGPMTWHAKSMTSSYVTLPKVGSKGNIESEEAFPFATASWYFLDAVDMSASLDTKVIVAFGDSITDGTSSTINGSDRWVDVLARRIQPVYGNKVSIINAGIGGNQIAGPAEYTVDKPFPGGQSAGDRIQKDLLSLSGVTTMIWLEGINDFSKNGNAESDFVIKRMTEIVKVIRASQPKIKIIGATVIPALGSTSKQHGFIEQDTKRKSLNEFIQNSKIFDGVIDFNKVMIDLKTGEMKPEFVPENTYGKAGDKLHPNRLGYLTMGQSIDINMLLQK